MDLNDLTATMVIRPNSILRKRKSTNKDNLLLKLTDNDFPRPNSHDNDDPNKQQQAPEYSMCLICRTSNGCSNPTKCNNRKSPQNDYDFKNSQQCTKLFLRNSPKLSVVSSPDIDCKIATTNHSNIKNSDATKICVFNDFNQRCNSDSSTNKPSFHQKITSSTFTLIPPIMSTSTSVSTTSSSTSIPQFIKCSSPSKSKSKLSTATAAAITPTINHRNHNQTSSSFSSLTPQIPKMRITDEFLSTCNNTVVTSNNANINNNINNINKNTSSSTKPSTTFNNNNNINNFINLFYKSVLRTFLLFTIIRNDNSGVFNNTSRQQQLPQPKGHEPMAGCRIKGRPLKRNYSPPPKYPLILMLLVFSIMSLMLPAVVFAEGRLQRNETVCKTRDIRNDPKEFNHLANCTVIEGFLLITLIDRANHSDYEMYSFPMLTEVTEFVMIYRVNGLRTLSTLFPNLSVIRGKELFEGFALVIYENTHLEDVGLVSLTTVARGAVRIEKNPELCFVETIDWTQIAVNMTSDQHFFRENKAKKECPQCPGDNEKSNDPADTSVTCPLLQGQRHCWNSKSCQKICPPSCKSNCNDNMQCCDDACIGGCAERNLSRCTSCRHFAKMDVCMEKCPENFFSYLERRCVTAEMCTKEIGTKLEGSKKETLVPFNGVCSVRCPPGHNKVNATCVKCEGKCVKKCEGGVIDSVANAKLLHGCTHIINSPLIISIKRGGRHLMEELELGLSSIEQIDTYLKVHRTYGIVSLAFFKNLKRIKGDILESGKFAMYVLENQDLESIWGQNQTVKIDEGRVFFHFNPKLCYSVIDSLRPSLKNASAFDKNEVASDSNGSKGSCNTEVLDVEVVKVSSGTAHVRITNPMKFDDDRAFIGYQFFHIEDPYKNVSMFDHKPCDDDWTSQDPSKDVEHIFGDLKPFTQYAFYVKTHTISSEIRNGQSPIMYFRTKPDQPKNVQNLKAVSNSSSEIIVHWLRPTITNGNLTTYMIKATLDTNELAKLKSRNYCNDPLKEAATGDMVLPNTIEKNDGNLLSGAGGTDCKCEKNVTRKYGSNPQMEEAIYENIIDFENNIQNFVYVKQSNDTSMDAPRRLRRRAVDFSNALEEKVLKPASVVPKKSIERNSTMDETGSYYIHYSGYVNASVTEFVLTKLKHFSLYTIAVKACRASVEGDTKKSCSPESIAYARTQKLADVDIIRNLQVELEQSNTTRGNLKIKWDPPERPNSLVVSYTIFYIVANSPDAVHEKRCITELDYQQNFTNGYVLTGLPTGNYSIQVRANSLAGEGIKSEPVYKYIPPNSISYQAVTLACIGVIGLLCIIGGAAYYIRKKFLAPPSDLKIFPTVNPYYVSMQYLPDEWEVPRDKIIHLGALGQGSFGMVYEGILKNFNDQEDTPCAIKTVNENATDRERLNFLKEASVMKQFNTHHVVRLLGVCSRGQPALVIMELMKNGDLKAFLRQHRPDAEPLPPGEPPLRPPTLGKILQIAIEIADGMAYLAAKKYVHRDLAARNCMVAADLTVKIGDFGMTRDVYETDYYRKGTKGLLPVRWMAPESLKDGVFSSASDVFSYGVVLWEMATLASQPYQGLSNDQVLRYVIDGGVMERPENCPDKLYKLMQKCWQHRPSARPTFMEIIRYLLDSADPKFQAVSFYHSPEAKDLIDQMQPEHDLDDVTTPLRVGEFDYKLNIDDNSSVEPHDSPVIEEEEDEIEEDEDDDEDDEDEEEEYGHAHSHSPYSHGSGSKISNNPRVQIKNPSNKNLSQKIPSSSLPPTSVITITASKSDAIFGDYVLPSSSIANIDLEPSPEEFVQQMNQSCDDGYANVSTFIEKPILNQPSTSSATIPPKFPSNSFKNAITNTVQNLSNNLIPSQLSNMKFLHRPFLKNNRNIPSSRDRGQRNNTTTKADQASSNSSRNISVEIDPTGTHPLLPRITSSHGLLKPGYDLLDETLNISATQSEVYPMDEITFSGTTRQINDSLDIHRGDGDNDYQQRDPFSAQPPIYQDDININQNIFYENLEINPKDSVSKIELSSNFSVENPYSIKDDKKVESGVPAQTMHPCDSKPLKIPPQLSPNGYVGHEGQPQSNRLFN